MANVIGYKNKIYPNRIGGGGGSSEVSYLTNGLVGTSAGYYTTCNLDSSLTAGLYLVKITDNGNEYVSIFTYGNVSQSINVTFAGFSGTLTITQTTAGLSSYSGSYRDIYCDIKKLHDI